MVPNFLTRNTPLVNAASKNDTRLRIFSGTANPSLSQVYILSNFITWVYLHFGFSVIQSRIIEFNMNRYCQCVNLLARMTKPSGDEGLKIRNKNLLKRR